MNNHTVHIITSFFSRNNGGIFTVINQLYNTHFFRNSNYSNLEFWGYNDLFSHKDIQQLRGKIHQFQIKLPILNKLYFSNAFRLNLTNSISPTDLVHLHSLWLYPSLLVSKISLTTGAKKIISIHGMLDKWALNNSKLKKAMALRMFEKRNLNSATCIHALCMQEYIDIRKIAPKVPIAIIPNGIYLPNEQLVKPNLKKEKTLLFLSRIHPKKGLENLIYAWKKTKTKNWILIISGPDEHNHAAQLNKLITDLNLEKSVKLVGPKFGPDKVDILSDSDAFILPSFSEGLPMSVLEAWSYKLPVLMTPQCNLPDGFDTNSAIRIEPEIESIVLGLNTIFSMSNDDLTKMGINGYNLVCERYTWEFVAKQMIELYDWVLGKIEKPSFVHLE